MHYHTHYILSLISIKWCIAWHTHTISNTRLSVSLLASVHTQCLYYICSLSLSRSISRSAFPYRYVHAYKYTHAQKILFFCLRRFFCYCKLSWNKTEQKYSSLMEYDKVWNTYKPQESEMFCNFLVKIKVKSFYLFHL